MIMNTSEFGGTALSLWILQVANAIVEFECIPESLKLGIVTPIYKGGGRDPWIQTATEVLLSHLFLAKVFESLILECL